MWTSKDLPEARQIYRAEVELTELGSGARRRVPLEAVRRIPLSRKKGEEAGPPDDVLWYKDGAFEIEARTSEELRERLRAQYPDDLFERRLHVWRDREAEERRERALEGLMKIIVDAAVREMLAEQGADGSMGCGEAGETSQ